MTNKILCIEDEADIRQVIVDELNDHGYKTIEAADGKAGLEAIVQQGPDLVLCDITMPVMDGNALLKELRAKHPEHAELPFVFLSALADRDHILAGKQLGVDDYLTKPIDFELLIATIQARLNQVQRMKGVKEEQLVKLYRSLSKQAAGDQDRPEATQREGTAPRPAATASASPVRSRIERLAEGSGGTILAGGIQVIGLDKVKARLAGHWPNHARKVLEIAEATIRGRLSPEDVFETLQDHRFMICFQSLNQQEAASKVQSIAREIQERILGANVIDAAMRESCGVSAEVHEIALTKTEIAETEDFVALIMTRLGQAAQRARDNEQKIMARLVDGCRIVQVRVAARKGASAPFVIADFDKSTKSDIAALRLARPASDDLTADIDYLRLGRSSELLCGQAVEAQPLLLVDVEFSTLNGRPLLERFFTVCSSMTDAARNRLALNVRGIPKKHTRTKIQHLAESLRPHCRLVMLELSELSLGNIDPEMHQIPIVSCNYQVLGPQIEKESKAFSKLLGAVHALKGRLLIYDVPSSKEIKRLLAQGADFVSCHA